MNKNRTILIFSLIIISANILVYSKAADYDFVNFDDAVRITENNTLKKLNKENLKTIFFSFQQANYQPLIFFTHAIQYRFFKLDPTPYHIINIIFHVINSLLVFLLIYYISKKEVIAFIVALFFSLHPVQVETVAWATELKGLMCTFFFLLSFIAYIHSSGDKKRRNYALCLIFFVIALLCKPIAVTLPIVFIIYDYCYKDNFNMSMIKEKIPLILIALVFSVIFYFAQKSGDAVITSRIQLVLTNVIFGFYSIGFYIIKLIFPKDLSVHYAYIVKIDVASVEFFLSLTVITAITLLIVYFKRIRREVLFGILFFIVNLLPILRFIPIGDTLAADRYLYMPIIGFFFAVTTAIYPYAVSKRSMKLTASVVAALYLGYLTYFTGNQLNTWQNSLTLWTNVQKSNKDHFKVYIGIGNYYMFQKDYKAAKEQFFKALEHEHPMSKELALYNLGFAGIKEGDFPSARKYFKALVERYPNNGVGNNSKAYRYLCAVGYILKNPVESEMYYMAGLRLSPTFSREHLSYIKKLERAGNIQEAIFHYKLALKYNKGWAVPEKALKRLRTAK